MNAENCSKLIHELKGLTNDEIPTQNGFLHELLDLILKISLAKEFFSLYIRISERSSRNRQIDLMNEDEQSVVILTATEVKEFFKGIPIVEPPGGYVTQSSRPENIPYDKSLEIAPFQLKRTDIALKIIRHV
jgi:hypothetical protein